MSRLTVKKALVEGYDRFIGIDGHKRTCHVTIKDPQGKTVKRGGIVTGKASVRDFLKVPNREEENLRRIAVIEAGRSYRPLYRWLCEEVDEVVLAHPGSLKIISETVYKDDKIDSLKLAELAMLGYVPEAHAASDEAWERRMVLRHRVVLVRMQTSLKNRMHAVVDNYPDALPRKPEVSDLFGKVGLDWFGKLELPTLERWRLDELLDLLDQVRNKIAASEAKVRAIVRQDSRCALLKTMPGIGDFFSALIVAEVDDIDRFPSAGQFVSYMGLVPSRDASGGVDHGGRLHKQGNSYLRWAFTEAAVPAMKSSLALRNHYDRICDRRSKKAGPNIAKCAVGRKLAEIAYRILKEERPYEDR